MLDESQILQNKKVYQIKSLDIRFTYSVGSIFSIDKSKYKLSEFYIKFKNLYINIIQKYLIRDLN